MDFLSWSNWVDLGWIVKVQVCAGSLCPWWKHHLQEKENICHSLVLIKALKCHFLRAEIPIKSFSVVLY